MPESMRSSGRRRNDDRVSQEEPSTGVAPDARAVARPVSRNGRPVSRPGTEGLSERKPQIPSRNRLPVGPELYGRSCLGANKAEDPIEASSIRSRRSAARGRP